MRRSCGAGGLVLLLGALLLAPRASAVSIDIIGAAGADGSDGVAGGNGTAGAPGGAASADATSPDATNSATAIGGAGGKGGAGSAPSGLGGAGGTGGSATANATTTGAPSDAFAQALAIGGDGGVGGLGADGSQAQSGSGGAAEASATAAGASHTSAYVAATGGNGGDGRPAGDGGTAHIGSVSASSTADYASATAVVTGGNGGSDLVSTDASQGHQGNGADSSIVDAVSATGTLGISLDQGALGGNAGYGAGSGAGAGHGGSAMSSLTRSFYTGQAYINVYAQGGAGSAGAASPGGTVGYGGAAFSTTDITASADDTAVNSVAYGGMGAGLGDAGDATEQSDLVILEPATEDFRTGSLYGQARGGDCAEASPACRGGNAASIDSGNAAAALTQIAVASDAFGGAGGSADPNSPTPHDGNVGGNARSDATAVSTHVAFAYANAGGGSGGDGAAGGAGGSGGTATASAHATALDYASAGIGVTGGGGGGAGPGGDATRGNDVSLENVPIAESPFNIALNQSATGGSSGAGSGSRGGDARSVLMNSTYSGLTMDLGAQAVGGSASNEDGASEAARGGDATVVVEGNLSGGRQVSVSGYAEGGGAYGPNAVGGNAVLESVFGHSDTGKVRADGTAAAGSGDVGRSLALVDAVRGETRGELFMRQFARGGDGTSSGGAGSSALHKTTDSSKLELEAEADGGSLYSTSGTPPSAAGDALAEASGTNTGHSFVTATANGGYVYSGGNGGDAEAHATSTHLGPGTLDFARTGTAIARTRGGDGGNIGLGLAGQGGDAHSIALAITAGGPSSSADAHAEAQGGSGVSLAAEQVGGGALAEATATALSPVFAIGSTATTIAGGAQLPDGLTRSTTAAAHSIARANGIATFVQADANAFGGPGSLAESHVATDFNVTTGLHASSSGSGGIFHSVAQTNQNSSLADVKYALDGRIASYLSALGPGSPSAWVAGNPNVQATLAEGGRTVANALVSSPFYAPDWDGSLSIELKAYAFEPGETVRLGFLDPEVPALGLDLLQVHISVDGSPASDMTFTNVAAALAGLNDTVVFLDPSLFTGPVATIEVAYHYESTRPSSGFLSNFVVIAPVPEPGLFVLVGLGALAALTRARAARGAR